MSRRWWHIHVLRGEEECGLQRHEHAHIDWWHGDLDHSRDEEPASLHEGVIREAPRLNGNGRESHVEQFFSVGSLYWPDQPSRLKHKVIEL